MILVLCTCKNVKYVAGTGCLVKCTKLEKSLAIVDQRAHCYVTVLNWTKLSNIN